MTNEKRKLALYCLKANSDLHGEVCEKCSQYPECDHFIQDNVMEELIEELEQQSCYNPDEWCHDCSEYDHDKHCCPRYNNVIRNAVEEIKESKVGHWISYWDEEARCHVYECPKCGNKQPFDTKCCWECGTRLIEPQKSEDKE